jgi:hypothetical protein
MFHFLVSSISYKAAGSNLRQQSCETACKDRARDTASSHIQKVNFEENFCYGIKLICYSVGLN